METSVQIFVVGKGSDGNAKFIFHARAYPWWDGSPEACLSLRELYCMLNELAGISCRIATVEITYSDGGVTRRILASRVPDANSPEVGAYNLKTQVTQENDMRQKIGGDLS